jgi:hypothetical protein
MFIDTTSDVASRVTGAIREAARVTGAGFDYLLKTAIRESNLDPNVKASTSSATGLFQFIDQTWLGTLKESGPALGYGRFADAITRTGSGRYVVFDPAMQREIMKLRTDPAAAAVMAGAFTNRNASELAEALGRKPSDGELYIAHFLGPSGAVRFIKAAANSPGAPAAAAFPEAARANRSIFYGRWGSARSFAQVYRGLVARHDATAVAAAPAAAVPLPPARPEAAAPAAAIAGVAPATRARAAAPALELKPLVVAQAAAAEPHASGGPVFHALFRNEQRGAVAPVVSELWGAKRAGKAQVAAAAPASEIGASRRLGAPLDLFQFLRPEIRRQVAKA